MIQLLAIPVALFLMLLGVGLMIGGVVALAKPGKVPEHPDQDKPRDWPVIAGLLVGGYVSLTLGRTLLGFLNPARRLSMVSGGGGDDDE